MDLISLEDALAITLANKEFMREYRRLTGHRLGDGPVIDRMIDESTGKLEDEARQFYVFVRDHIWMPVIAQSVTCRIQAP